MHTPVPFIIFRVALQDHLLGNIKIEKGTCLNLSIFSMHYNSLYYDKPEEFIPERWLESDSLKNPY
jgi:cytochrome P450